MAETVSMPEFEGFDWSGGNAEKNWELHAVSPSESEQAFFNRPLLVSDDERHTAREERWYVLGQTDAGRELFIAFTRRRKLIRVISSRDMSRKERKAYRAS